MTQLSSTTSLWEDDLALPVRKKISERTVLLGQELFARFRFERPRPWQRRWWDDQVMAWTMRDERLKVELFRFVDVLPMLKSSDDIASHLLEYSAEEMRKG